MDPENESTMEVLQSTKKDLDRLREYAFQVVSDFCLFNTQKSFVCYEKQKKSDPFDFLFFSFFFEKKI